MAPNPVLHHADPPIVWVGCRGTWEAQTNPVEAKRIVDELSGIWQKYDARGEQSPSIGIITFNAKQQELVKNIIDKRLDEDAEFARLYAEDAKKPKDSSVFVKNIETVQGDERDIIMLGVGYAPDAEGNFVNMFGSLSAKGGEKRLNVAVTRARKKMIIVSSIQPSAIKPTSANLGPQHLRKFLEYAKSVSDDNLDAKKAVLSGLSPDMRIRDGGRSDVFDSEFEVQVCSALRKMGYEVKTQENFVGYRIDLAIVHPKDRNRYILGIECDGATFHSAKSVKERDVLRQKFLESNGWNIERIWSSDWWRSPKNVLQRIQNTVDDLASS